MTRHRCAWGTCNSDVRYKDRDYMKGVTFFTFPRPVLDETFHPETVKCSTWIKMCGRSAEKLNLKMIWVDHVKKRNYYYRICSKV